MKFIIITISFLWCLIAIASFSWNYYNAKSEVMRVAFHAARSFFDQIVITRQWCTVHGGVYVPVTEETKPNPYLQDTLKTIVVSDDLTLTKLNPAYMTRQIGERAETASLNKGGIVFHITSLKPIRPLNKATPLEESYLMDFEKGVREKGEVIFENDKIRFFYMAPLKTEKSCLKCHSIQGYKEGDIRGGISVSLPFVPEIPLMSLSLAHGVIAVLGVLGIVFGGYKLNDAYVTIKRQAVFDALTGIPNRRSFTQRILSEYKRSRRNNYPLCVIMGDVDHFKLYNDTYGHKQGDECLKIVAATILGSLKRPGDYCARYGGEEFVMILPDTPLEGAAGISEKIRSNILLLNIPHEKSSSAEIVTISLGLAIAEGDSDISYEQLISHADEALYTAKHKGRNRVEVFG